MAKCNKKCPRCCKRDRAKRGYCQRCRAHKYIAYLRRHGLGWVCRSKKKCTGYEANYRK